MLLFSVLETFYEIQHRKICWADFNILKYVQKVLLVTRLEVITIFHRALVKFLAVSSLVKSISEINCLGEGVCSS